MLTSPLSSPSPRMKADVEKKLREAEENERRKIYAEREGEKICSTEERPGEISSDKERIKYTEEEREEEEDEEKSKEESEEEEEGKEVVKRYNKETASCQDVAQVNMFFLFDCLLFIVGG